MDEQVENRIEQVSKLLNGQIRGAINKKAREINLGLIEMTLTHFWSECSEYMLSMVNDAEVLIRLKKELQDDSGESK